MLEFLSNVVSSDQINSLVLTEMSGDQMVMIVLQNPKPEVAYIEHVDAIVKTEQPFWVHRPAKNRVVEMGRDGQIRMDIRVEGLNVHDDGGLEYQSIEGCSMEGGSQLLVSEDWAEIVWVYRCIISFPLSKVDIPLSS